MSYMFYSIGYVLFLEHFKNAAPNVFLYHVSALDTDTLLGRGRPQTNTWIRKKWPRLLRSGVLLLNDNVRPHSVTATQNHIATLGWERLDHPPCSPDLAPSEFHQFPASKKNLAGKRFGREKQA
ncbi:UNVERIFIED_CONTAM: Histone-lysine N-methyltransferase SETMAR [Trichonephila clavipes]